MSCPAEAECIYSAKRIYEDDRLAHGKAGWPVNIVDPEIEDLLKECGPNSAIRKLRERLAEDYDNDWQREAIECRPWFGRCVYESDNDVCDDQLVTIAWEDEPLLLDQKKDIAQCLQGRGAKTAIFHMVALTEKQCKRRGRIYGTKGEIEYDSNTISVYDFASKETRLHHPHHPGGRHGGGDIGLAQQYVKAIHAIKNENINVPEAQNTHIGCTLDDIIRSHAMVFAAEEARKQKKVIDWRDWWTSNIESSMKCSD